MEHGVCGLGGVPPCPSFPPAKRADLGSLVPPGEFNGSLYPVSSNQAAEGTVLCSRHYDLGKMLLLVPGSNGKQVSGDDPMYGGTFAHCIVNPPEGHLRVCMAGV